MISAKFVHQDTVRRVSFPLSWAGVRQQAQELFALDEFTATYVDADRDRVTVSSDAELVEAARDAAQTGRVLRLTLRSAAAEEPTPGAALRDMLRKFVSAGGDRELELFIPMTAVCPQRARCRRQASGCTASPSASADEELAAALAASMESFRRESSGESEQQAEAEGESKATVPDVAREAAAVARSRSASPVPRATVPDVAREAAEVARSRSASPVDSGDEFQVVDAAASDDEGRAEVASPSESAYPIAHAVLQSLGMTDAAANERYLVEFEGDVDRTVSALMSS